jgi:hypothetical protein
MANHPSAAYIADQVHSESLSFGHL